MANAGPNTDGSQFFITFVPPLPRRQTHDFWRSDCRHGLDTQSPWKPPAAAAAKPRSHCRSSRRRSGSTNPREILDWGKTQLRKVREWRRPALLRPPTGGVALLGLDQGIDVDALQRRYLVTAGEFCQVCNSKLSQTSIASPSRRCNSYVRGSGFNACPNRAAVRPCSWATLAKRQ